MKTISCILIANRGEIACSIIRACKQLGIKTIAIYTEHDKNALHAQQANQAFQISSYRALNTIIDIALAHQADAIHPGYGFLAEDPHFPEACRLHDLIFIGPSAQAMSQMGIKDKAKTLMQAAGVPVLTSEILPQQDTDAIAQLAEKIGYPLILKPTHGGGGKGMRIVVQAADLIEALASAKRESLASCGNESLMIEQYITQAKHIEIQIFRDSFGNTLHLFERDCSLQRRYQKVIEQAPAINIDNATLQAMYQAAITAVQSIDYQGAGTIEFLLDSNNHFYFMEMNTRIQVEHPITEMITGIDVIAWQIKIAQGEPLPLNQEQIHCQGYAIEARICAEDPSQNFSATFGEITQILLPKQPWCRVEIGYQVGDTISIYYDSLIAKLIVYGENRTTAIARFNEALADFHLFGVGTNQAFVQKIINSDFFVNNHMDTQSLTHYLPELTQSNSIAFLLSQACLIYVLQRQAILPGWRLNLAAQETITLEYQNNIYSIKLHYPALNQPYYHLLCPALDLDTRYHAQLEPPYIHCVSPLEQHSAYYVIQNHQHNTELEVFSQGQSLNCCFRDFFIPHTEAEKSENLSIIAPMPGIVNQIWIKSGESIQAGDKCLTLEAMKMEHTLVAPQNGIIKNIYCRVGDQIRNGTTLIDFERPTHD